MKKALLYLVPAALLLSGCARSLRIGQLNSDPSRYINRSVRLEGRVTNSFGALGTGGYQIDDGSGRIFVVSSRGIPAKGATVAVTGKVQSGVMVMGKSWGTTLAEENHRVTGWPDRR